MQKADMQKADMQKADSNSCMQVNFRFGSISFVIASYSVDLGTNGLRHIQANLNCFLEANAHKKSPGEGLLYVYFCWLY